MVQTIPIHSNKLDVTPRLLNEFLCELEVKRMKLDGIILLPINYEREFISIKGDNLVPWFRGLHPQ